jgi:hypothetical protein
MQTSHDLLRAVLIGLAISVDDVIDDRIVRAIEKDGFIERLYR